MQELRREFLSEAISNLDILQRDLLTQESFTDASLQELFRRIHTIKGTSQTFGFSVSGRIAHEIENILQFLREGKISQNREISTVIQQGVGLLRQTLETEQKEGLNDYPQLFIEQIRALIPQSDTAEQPEIFCEDIPNELLANLSPREISFIKAAIQNGKSFFLIDAGFDFSNFDTRLKELNELLRNRGEIAATSPSPNVDPSKQIGFQLFFVGKIDKSALNEIVAPFEALITFECRAASGSFTLPDVLSKIVAGGEEIASSLGKKVEFKIIAEELAVSPQNLKIIYELLLHLTRNAVDHAIESAEIRALAGKNACGGIELKISSENHKIVLRVKDDGGGIDVKDIIEKAQAKGLELGERILSEKDALELIFRHGFSTSKTISGISGRGVGLDIVKEVVDNAKGEIKIQTKLGQGTTFEVRLPQDI